MICAWKELLSILPLWLRQDVDRFGKEQTQEIRLRLNCVPELIGTDKKTITGRTITSQDLDFVINTASRYSPWTATTTSDGYITAPGGHRIGLCGEAVMHGTVMTGIRSLRSLNIRIARDFPGVAGKIVHLTGNLLIIGPPGSGKTTLLRDLIRQRSRRETVAVVDSRGELFPQGLDTGQAVDILTGCGKVQGIAVLLRTMGPDTVAVDEITAAADCEALVQAGWCGVQVLATAHGFDRHDLLSRPIYRPIIESGLFSSLVVLNRDKTFRIERMRV